MEFGIAIWNLATDNNIANIENDWCPNIVLYHGMGDPVLVGADNNIGKLGANMEMSSGQDSLTVNELLQLESVGGGAIMISCIEFKISFQIFYHVDFNLKHCVCNEKPFYPFILLLL